MSGNPPYQDLARIHPLPTQTVKAMLKSHAQLSQISKGIAFAELFGDCNGAALCLGAGQCMQRARYEADARPDEYETVPRW